ncbi:MAG: tetraacyldisaccharide 4'-kinase [Planctomycetes bacterium]|nr:tetraacyldisaccharide 4'-kinase [Planctomycetota bacterium]
MTALCGPDQQCPNGTPSRGPLPGLLGRVASACYGEVIRRRNRRFDTGRGVIRFDRPVISVGNLSVGGTGKTPMVSHIVATLAAAGHTPCIAMRGYGAAHGESDEAGVYNRELPGVPVVARPDRAEGLIDLFATERGERVDCIVLDDGFQHRRIARDFDIVLIDATRSPWEDRLLPAGWLREPTASLARADAIVWTHAGAVTGELLAAQMKMAQAVAGDSTLLAACDHVWAGFAGAGAPVLGALRGMRVAACCAIGNPGPFMARCREEVGGRLAAELVLRDHDRFAPATVEKLKAMLADCGAQALLVTEKDWTKLRSISDWPCPVYRPKLAMRFVRNGSELDAAVLAASNGDRGSERDA